MVSKVGRELYEKFFRGYTRKQWGLDPSELDKSVTARVPTRTNRDDRYFTDTYQAMPARRLHAMFERMLDHPNIDVAARTSTIADVQNRIPLPRARLHRAGRRVLRLPLRQAALPLACAFEHETLDQERFQPVGVVNYPQTTSLHPRHRVQAPDRAGAPEDQHHLRVPVRRGRPLLPGPAPENAGAVQAVRGAGAATPDVCFVGRLATYRYYNMDQVVGQALATFRRINEAIPTADGRRLALAS